MKLIILIITIIVIVILLLMFICSIYNQNVTNKLVLKYDAKPLLQELYMNTYCGKHASLNLHENQGPIFKYTPNGSCFEKKPGTSDDFPGRNQEDFWLNGNLLEIILNYTETTGDKTFEEIILKDVSNIGQLQQQLLNGLDGTWNDDRMWWALAYIRMWEYNPNKFGIELLAGSQIFNKVHETSFNSFICSNTGKTYYTTWWQLLPALTPEGDIKPDGDPTGINTYRNAVTNSLYLELAMRLYQIGNIKCVDTSRVFNLQNNDLYWDIAKKEVEFLSSLKMDNGLIADGYKNLNGTRKSLDESVNCGYDERPFTYTQGVILDGFAKVAVEAYKRKENDLYNHCMDFIYNLITLMILNPEENIGTNNSCKLHINKRIDCIGEIGGNQTVCLKNNECCFDSNLPGNINPLCYKKSIETLNPLLTTVNNDRSMLISILTETFDHYSDSSGNAFKGIFIRYLTYTIIFKHHKKEYSNKYKNLIIKAKTFIQNNVNYVIINSKNKNNNLYSFFWNLSLTQTSNLPDNFFTTASTGSVIDLINSYNYLN
jgi:predicted alpha-1,6-mannanase (GH76 family)